YGAYELAFRWHAYHFLQTAALGKLYAANTALNNLGSCLLLLGAYDQADAIWRQAITIQQRRDIVILLAESLPGAALVGEARGDHAGALPLALEAVDCARRSEYKHAELRPRLLVALLHARLDPEASAALAARVLAFLPAWPRPEQHAAIYHTAWRIDAAN